VLGSTREQDLASDNLQSVGFDSTFGTRGG
jgi:hypothetical protein